MNEAETRAEHIDPALAAAGWGVVEGSRIRREYRIDCAFDTDEPGEKASRQMMGLHPSIQRLRPPGHDWNDVLTAPRK